MSYRSRSAMALVVALLIVVGMQGCGPNYPEEKLGVTGLQREVGGTLTVVVLGCQGSIDDVRVARIDPADNEDQTRAVTVSAWERAASPADGLHELPLDGASKGWVRVIDEGGSTQQGMIYSISATGQLGDKGVRSASSSILSSEAIASLPEGQVLLGDDEVLTRTEFNALCPDKET